MSEDLAAGPAAPRGDSTSFRFTIGRLMVVTAGVAGVLAAIRAIGDALRLIFAISLATGWLAWRVTSGRPRLAAVGVGGALVAWPVALMVLPIGTGYVAQAALLLSVGSPTLLGFGLAWCQADEQRGTIRLLAATVALSLLAAIYLPVVGVLLARGMR